MSFGELKQFAEKVTDWYWQYNSQRADNWKLSSGWLDRLYYCRKIITDMAQLEERPAVGFWGPSQAGKSSMMSTDMDVKGDIQGSKSALTWDPAHPCRFRGTAKTETVTSEEGKPITKVVEVTNVALNPYHGGGDATGCVTRYILRKEEDIPYINFPVEIRLASRKALIHALAAGFLTECVREGNDGTTMYLHEKDIMAVLERQDAYGDGGGHLLDEVAAVPPRRDTYELLREICDVVRLLFGIHDPRFQNLNSNWRGLTTKILNEKTLTGSLENTLRFMRWLLWENKTVLNTLFNTLSGFLTLHEGSRYFCTLEVASILVDIAATEWLFTGTPGAEHTATTNEAILHTVALIRRLRYTQTGNDILISTTDGENALFADPDKDFGYFQACIQELVVPIHLIDGMSEQFKTFIQKADFLDFPGVAQQAHDQGSETTKINADALEEKKRHLLLTQLMKRGRTASIVSNYAEIGEIDSFVLMVRSANVIANAGQLINGIRQWWQYADADYDGHGMPPLPLFLALTFAAKIINDVTSNHGQLPDGGLAPHFKWLDELAELSRPDVAKILMTTYKHRSYENGDITDSQRRIIEDTNHPELNAAMLAISADETFQKLFGTKGTQSYQSFEETCLWDDGGVNFLFSQIAGVIDAGRKRDFKHAKYLEMQRELRRLMDEALPSSADADTVRRAFLNNFADRVDHALHNSLSPVADELGFATQAAWISFLVRNLQSVNPSQMPRFTEGMDIQRYITDVVNSLASQLEDDSKRDAKESWYQEIGLDNHTDIAKLVDYLVDRKLTVPNAGDFSIPECIFMWCNSFGIANLAANDVVHELSVVIENIVWHGYVPVLEDVVIGGGLTQGIGFKSRSDYTVLNVDAAIKQIDNMRAVHIIPGLVAAAPSPHETAVVKPFVQFVREVAQGTGTNQRGVQAGDNELTALVASCADVPH